MATPSFQPVEPTLRNLELLPSWANLNCIHHSPPPLLLCPHSRCRPDRMRNRKRLQALPLLLLSIKAPPPDCVSQSEETALFSVWTISRPPSSDSAAMLGLCGKHLGPFIPAGGPLRPLGLQGLSAQRSMRLARRITTPQEPPPLQSLRGTSQIPCSMGSVRLYLERREPSRLRPGAAAKGGHVCGFSRN